MSAARLERRTWTITEVAQLLGVSRSTAYEMAKRGDLPTILCGSHYKVPKAALENYLRACDPYAEPLDAGTSA